jgi:cytochrome P450
VRRKISIRLLAGANLARLELAEALIMMTQRMPHARRTGPAPWKPLTAPTEPTTLPIEFDVAPRY